MYVRMTSFKTKAGKKDMENFEDYSVGVPTQKSYEIAASSNPPILRIF